MNRKSIITLVICLLIPLAVGFLSGMVTAEYVPTWYQTLSKPSFTPPAWVFSPVWTLLYILMGISLFIVWKSPKDDRRNWALNVFSIQLGLNFSWTFIFFFMHLIGFAFAELIILWFAAIGMTFLFFRVNRLAGILQIPYLLWLFFASILNGAIWVLN